MEPSRADAWLGSLVKQVISGAAKEERAGLTVGVAGVAVLALGMWVRRQKA